MNVVFYDGHAETMEELAACNPKFWVPKGTVLQSTAIAKIWPDVQNQYQLTGLSSWTAP